MGEAIRVLVGINDPIFYHSLQASLAQHDQITFIGHSGEGTSLLTMCGERRPDVLILDLHLVMSTGKITIQAYKQVTPGLKALVIFADQDCASLSHLRQQGADGVILQSDPPEKWLEAIAALTQNERWLSARLMQSFLEAPKHAPDHDLSKREKIILRLVAAGKTDKEIARHLQISTLTVRYDLANACQKLGVQSRIEAAVYATSHHLLDP